MSRSLRSARGAALSACTPCRHSLLLLLLLLLPPLPARPLRRRPPAPAQHWPYALDPACTVAPPPYEHRLGYSPEHYLSVWRAMEALVDEGLVRALGCSNMTVRKLEALWPAAVHKPVNIQVELHPFLAQHALKAYCDARGILMTGYHPLGSPSRPAQ